MSFCILIGMFQAGSMKQHKIEMEVLDYGVVRQEAEDRDGSVKPQWLPSCPTIWIYNSGDNWV